MKSGEGYAPSHGHTMWISLHLSSQNALRFQASTVVKWKKQIKIGISTYAPLIYSQFCFSTKTALSRSPRTFMFLNSLVHTLSSAYWSPQQLLAPPSTVLLETVFLILSMTVAFWICSHITGSSVLASFAGSSTSSARPPKDGMTRAFTSLSLHSRFDNIILYRVTVLRILSLAQITPLHLYRWPMNNTGLNCTAPPYMRIYS